MKKVLSLVAVLTLIMSIFVVTTGASAYYAVYSHCGNGKPLNVRSGPGKEYSVIDKVPYGEAIYVIGDVGNGWLQLNDVGYVQASLTSRSKPGPYVPSPDDPATTTEAGYNAIFAKARIVNPYTVTLRATKNSKGVANVRWAPSKKASLMKAYADGSRVLVLATLGNNWYQVQDPETNAVGFVNTAYVEK